MSYINKKFSATGINQKPAIDLPGTPTDIKNPIKDVSQSPEQKRIVRKQERLKRNQERLKKQLDKATEKAEKKMTLASKIRKIVNILQLKEAQYNPNDNPLHLYNQISTNLGKLGLKGDIDKGKGDILILMNKKKGDEYLYQIKFRDDTRLDKDLIKKFNREKFVEEVKLGRNEDLLYLWGPYEPSSTETETREEEITTEIG